jgi:hypothetical protein
MPRSPAAAKSARFYSPRPRILSAPDGSAPAFPKIHLRKDARSNGPFFEEAPRKRTASSLELLPSLSVGAYLELGASELGISRGPSECESHHYT